jgi:RimJ/RimL family protein N-acetyltransferase
VLEWAFTIIGLHNVMLESYQFNEQAIRAYQRAGFRVIGTRRDSVRALGRRWDSILMDATAEEFYGSTSPRRIA